MTCILLTRIEMRRVPHRPLLAPTLALLHQTQDRKGGGLGPGKTITQEKKKTRSHSSVCRLWDEGWTAFSYTIPVFLPLLVSYPYSTSFRPPSLLFSTPSFHPFTHKDRTNKGILPPHHLYIFLLLTYLLTTIRKKAPTHPTTTTTTTTTSPSPKTTNPPCTRLGTALQPSRLIHLGDSFASPPP